MKYKKCNNKILVRIDPNEEIITEITNVANQEKIKLANISAIGGVYNFTIGVYNTKEKKYYSNNFTGNYEIVSLLGTITTMNNLTYLHLHMSAGDERGIVVGGHLNNAIVSATCEVVIDIIDDYMDRIYNEEIGLNIFNI